MIHQPKWLTRRVACLFSVCICCVLLPVADGRGESAQWTEPDIDSWVYENAGDGGGFIFGPVFTNLPLDGQQFETHTLASPARLGAMLVAFETSETIDVGLDPSLYSISSVTLTARVQNGTNGSLIYTDQPITPAGLLADALGSGITEQLPLELFGVGFRYGFEGFDLGGNAGTTLFNESTFTGSYPVHPVIGDGSGGYRDVLNNITGGASATEAGGQTSPFTATPWAIGTAGLSNGQVVPDDTTVTFNLDLAEAGVLSYVQNSLSEGSLGFFLSSMHLAENPNSGSGFPIYPQWYAKEAVGLFPNAEAATLSVEYTILSSFEAGDYDRDGDVDLADYTLWQSTFGSAVAAAGDGADGNSDGVVDAADYTVWRDSLSVSTIAVPEPVSAGYLLMALATIFGKRRSFSRDGGTSPQDLPNGFLGLNKELA